MIPARVLFAINGSRPDAHAGDIAELGGQKFAIMKSCLLAFYSHPVIGD
jgi:hypothetical protein